MAEGGETRNPISHRTKGQAKRDNAKPEAIARRVKTDAARAAAVAAGLAHKGDGKDIDHKKPLRAGGSNAVSNLRSISKARNRGWADGSR